MIVFINILLLAFCAKSSYEQQKPVLVSEPPSDPLEPIDEWLWTRVGDGGYLYQYPLEFGANERKTTTESPVLKPIVKDPNELLSLESWLQNEVGSGNVSADLNTLMLSITEAIKTITAITKFPVTRNIAVTKGIYETAAPTAFKDEILLAPGSAGLLFSSTDKVPLIIDRSKSVAVSIVSLLCSDNIELGLPHGSIFLVSEMVWTGLEPIAAGYVLYGSATILIITLGTKVLEFTLDQGFTFRLTNFEVKVPETGDYYSIDEGFESTWISPKITKIVKEKSSVPGSKHSYDCIISDIHRIIKKGGIYISPSNKLFPSGQFSIRYQLSPLAFILDKAGGLASNGSVPILDLKPMSHAIMSQVFMGSIEDVKKVEEVLATKETAEVKPPSLSYFLVPVENNEP